MYQYTKDEKYLENLIVRLNSLCSIMGNVGLSSFCNGYAGIAWTIRFLYNKKILDIDNINNLVEQLNKLKKPSSEKMEAALSAVEEYLNAGRMAAEYLELYKNL